MNCPTVKKKTDNKKSDRKQSLSKKSDSQKSCVKILVAKENPNRLSFYSSLRVAQKLYLEKFRTANLEAYVVCTSRELEISN